MSYANIVLALFRIPVPENDRLRIGTLLHDSSGVSSIIPRIYVGYYSPESVHETVEDYLGCFIDSATNYKRPLEKDKHIFARSCTMLQRLKKHLVSIWQALPTGPRLRRLALKHDDLRLSNILLDPSSGAVTGVIDWEYHSVQPSVLAVEYPWWLDFAGQDDPRFASSSTWWHCTQEEGHHYRQLFEQVLNSLFSRYLALTPACVLPQIVREKDADFYDCLIAGKTLRDGISWLKAESLDSDPGCERLGNWMDATFGQESQ